MTRSIGQATTSSTSRVPLTSTTYTEQSAGTQCSLQSSSASDTSSGTGAQKVRITYYELSGGAVTGPFTETVTLDGTTAVSTDGTAICLIEKMEVVAAGSGAQAAGTISLYNATGGSGGSGAAFCSIAAGDVTTRLGHHYVASNRQCLVGDLVADNSDSSGAQVELVQTPYPLTGVELPLCERRPATGTTALPVGSPLGTMVPGPARLRLLVTPQDTNSQTTNASFGYTDVPSQAF